MWVATQEQFSAIVDVDGAVAHFPGNWRERLREGLSYLFPGPLWFVYE